MFRFLFKFIFYAVVLLVLLCGIAWFFKESLASSWLTKTMGTSSSIENIQLSPEQLTVSGIEIRNPEGAALEHALKVEKVGMTFQLADLMKRQTKIKEIRVENPFIGIEMYNSDGSDNNWARMLEKTDGEAAAPSNKEPAKQKIHIEHLLITNTEIEAINTAVTKKVIRPNPISKIELFDVYSDDPNLFGYLVSLITRAILREVSGLDALPNLLKDQLQDQLQDKIKKIPEVPKEILKKLPSPFSENSSENNSHCL